MNKSPKQKRQFSKDQPVDPGEREDRRAHAGKAVAMPRVKRSLHARKKRRKVLEQAKGYWGLKSSNYTYAKEQVERSLAYAYRDRKVHKREFRKLWIMRINAGARANGLSYNQFIAGLKAANVELDRKVLADIAVADPAKFGEIVEQAKSALAKWPPARQGEIFHRQAAYCDGRSPLYAESVVGSRAIRGSATSRPTSRGTCRCGCSAACTTSCSAAKRRGTTSTRRSSSTRVPAPLVRGAGGADERGAALVGALARVPLARRRAAVRPARARPVRGAEPPVGPLRYRYSSGTWGSGELELRATTACRRRRALFTRRVEVARRRGVDLNPIDVTTADGARVLQAFVWPDQAERLERLQRAIEVARRRSTGADARRLRRGAAGDAARPR